MQEQNHLLRRMFAPVFVSDLVGYLFLLLALCCEFLVAQCFAKRVLDLADGNVLPRCRPLRHPDFAQLLLYVVRFLWHEQRVGHSALNAL